MNYAQWTLIGLMLLNFMVMVHVDYTGRPEIKPKGSRGLIATVILHLVWFWLYWQAGLFVTRV